MSGELSTPTGPFSSWVIPGGLSSVRRGSRLPAMDAHEAGHLPITMTDVQTIRAAESIAGCASRTTLREYGQPGTELASSDFANSMQEVPEKVPGVSSFLGEPTRF